ncbi:NFACT family protein [Natroniella acetigena]|uniref:Rqc2 family fibronectin-binding protein n=1 Tax=Natroniella acetigena TaxID=52004 RepID=UPI00200B7836|nr:NFACT RNA binding domain-containing protein [Natroniella acetigena]MCK8827753.1 NFACT family protein [Natroniella acetigena]
MALDGITLAAVKSELSKKLLKGRIDKIYQPQEHLLTIRLRQPGENIKLLISANPQEPRIHITDQEFDNPLQPPAFCMLLRKHIQSGRIKEIKQPDFERILEITIQYKNNQGELEDKILVIELMGRHSNIILLKEDRQILDSIKRITSNMSRHREILPGKKYLPPPEQDKKNPLTTNQKEFKSTLGEKTGQTLYKTIMKSYRGIGPTMATEIAHRSPVNEYDELTSYAQIKELWPSFNGVFKQVSTEQFEPTLILDESGNFEAYAALKLEQFEGLEKKKFDSINQLLNFYFVNRIIQKKINNLIRKMENTIEKNKENAYKKYRRVNGQLKGAYNADKYQLKGELITANIYQLEKGMKKAKLQNYYADDSEELTIQLDPKLSPAENAQYYFKKYEKAKRSIKYLKNEVRKAKNEINYLKQLETNIEQAETILELEEIYQELVDEGYIKEQRANQNKKDRKLPPLKFKSTKGYDILVGRNNRQNDKLTKRMANNQDLWFHVKEIPGSHVIVRNHTRDEIPEDTILEAAQIAAFHSKGRESSNVPVDYTQVKHVNKPKGAKPGMVYYENQTTLYVDPDQELVESLEITD